MTGPRGRSPRPIATRFLTKQAQCRIPRTVLAAEHPSPIGLVWKQQPRRLSHCPARWATAVSTAITGPGGISGPRCRQNRAGRRESTRESPAAGAPDSRRAFLEAVKRRVSARARGANWARRRRLRSSFSVGFPAHTNPIRSRGCRLHLSRPGIDQGAIGMQVRNALRNGLEPRVKNVRQVQQRTVQIKRRQRPAGRHSNPAPVAAGAPATVAGEYHAPASGQHIADTG